MYKLSWLTTLPVSGCAVTSPDGPCNFNITVRKKLKVYSARLANLHTAMLTSNSVHLQLYLVGCPGQSQMERSLETRPVLQHDDAIYYISDLREFVNVQYSPVNAVAGKGAAIQCPKIVNKGRLMQSYLAFCINPPFWLDDVNYVYILIPHLSDIIVRN